MRQLVLGLVLSCLSVLGCSSYGYSRLYIDTPIQEQVGVISDSQARALTDSVVKITIRATHGTAIAEGSGVIVAHYVDTDHTKNLTVVLTAGHVAQAGPVFTVIYGGQLFQGLVMQDGKADWGLLGFGGLIGVPIHQYLRDGRAPSGTPVVHIGYPKGILIASRGGIVKPVIPEDGWLVNHTAPTDFGSSGGAIIALLGGKPTLLGIHVRRFWMNGQPLYGQAVPMETVFNEGGVW